MENEYLVILNKIQNGIILFDTKLNIVIWNEWIENLSGINKENAVGKSIYDTVPLFNSPLYINIFKDALDNGLNRFCSGMIHNIFVYPKGYNKSKFYKQSMQVEQVSIDNKKYVLLQIKDVTVEYERINKLKNIIRELNKQKKIADEANKAKSMFLANMSHEIRTPLNGSSGFLQLLDNTQLDMEQKNYVEIIKNSTNILINTINDILDISKIEAGKIDLEYIEFDLYTVIRESILTFTAIANQKKVKLNLYISPEVPRFVIGDSTRLKQVIMNLVGNAVKFTHEGYIDVIAEINSSTHNNDEITFTIKDTGMGISSEAMDKLFKPFTQADASLTRKFGGTGLGLAICKNIVELMEGHISVESEEGRGARFTFSVILKKAENNDIKTSNQNLQDSFLLKNTDQEGSYYGMKILLVEDNDINSKLFVKLLEMKGLKCDKASNGAECIRACAENDYDIVFMDCQMPVMDGYEATKKLREIEGDKKHTIIIAMTANTMKKDVDKCLNVGMDEYISKPIDISRTMSLIEKYANMKNNYFTEVVSELMKAADLDKKISEKIVREFCSESEKMILGIKKNIDDENFEDADKLLHQLKGSSGNVRANAISRKAMEAEDAIKFKDNKKVWSLLDDIEGLIIELSK